MAVTLTKGNSFSLKKEAPGLQIARIGAGWDPNETGSTYDVDISAFLLGADGKIFDVQEPNAGENSFLFYNQKSLLNGAVVHSGDCRTGGKEDRGDDEAIIVNFSKLPASIQKVVFVVTIHDAQAKGQNFGQIPNSWVNLYNEEVYQNDPTKKLAFFELSEEFSVEDCMIPVEFEKQNDGWVFNAIGAGVDGGLMYFCNKFGIQVA